MTDEGRAGEGHTDGRESVLDRAVQILGAFGAASPVLSAAQIARRTGMPAPTVYRMVGELLRLGILEREADKRLRIGIRLWELASRSSPAMGLRTAALPFMEDLQAVVRQHTILGIILDREVIYLETLSAPGAASSPAKIAGRLPLHAGSNGLVLLAFAAPELQEQVLAEPLVAVTPRTVTDPKQLRRILSRIRRDGHFVAERMIREDGAGVAVPIRGADGSVVAALSVAVANNKQVTARMIPALKAASNGITRTLVVAQSAPAGQWPMRPGGVWSGRSPVLAQ
ncbi:IclR family transcriptional regulator [Catenulispora pinisilvae]|uniref:IclR family transcriptional regulator n=1 Tax=Catenulispora pinisilvae TaxID=2705253 RepID=UPI0018922DC9|nr:IclR family transcriptional regulator [Catenulispora pinisilvae]